MSPNSVENLAAAIAVVGPVVDGVRDDQWSAATPCGDWSVRQLTDHVVSGDRLFATILSGTPMPPLEELRRRAAEDHLGSRPSAAYREAARELLAAFELPGVLDEVHGFPVGPLPGRAAIQLRPVETLVHGWDLATATGQPVPFTDSEADDVLRRARVTLRPEYRGPDTAMGEEVEAPAGAAPIVRLAAFMGRDVVDPCG
jgi:uncharacterized protein (TIGR03086 family)